MKNENSKTLKDTISFFVALIISAGLSASIFILFLSDAIFSLNFWVTIAAGVAIYYLGYRTANLSKPFTIYEFLEKQKPLKLDCIAIDAIGLAIIKRKRESAEEKKHIKEISDNIAKIVSTIEESAKDGKGK